MPIPPLIKELAEQKLKKYCDERIPVHVRDKLRLSYGFRGNTVTLFEERAPWRAEMTEWTSHSVAQMRFDQKTNKWTLYCADRNGKWHKYEGLSPTGDIALILKEIDRDPTGIFWG